MTDDERLSRILDQAAQGAPPTRQELEEDELLAELIEGTTDLERADEAVLERLIQRHGTEVVAELIGSGRPSLEGAPASRERGSEPGAAPSSRPRGWLRSPQLRVAAGLLIAAGVLWVAQREPRPEPVEVAWGAFDAFASPPTASAAASAELVGQDPLDEVLRGGGRAPDPELLRHFASIRADGLYGSGVVLDREGRVVTASRLVDSAVQAAAWQGSAARVELQLVELVGERVEPAGPPRTASVLRHAPQLGLSLLQLEDAASAPVEADLLLVPPTAGGLRLLGPSGDVLGVPESGRLDEPRGLSDVLAELGVDAWPLRARPVSTFVPARREGLFRASQVGAPIFADGALAGVVLVGGERGGPTWFAPASDIEALLDGAPPEPELSPPSPWHLPADARRTLALWSADDRLPALVAEVEHEDGAGYRAFFFPRGGAAQAVGAPRGLVSGADAGTFAFDLFVMLEVGGRVALGTTDAGGNLERVWTGDRATGWTDRLWTRAAGGWEVRELDEPLGNPAWLEPDQRALLETLR